MKKLVETAVTHSGKAQCTPYIQEELDLSSKTAVEAADRKRFAFVNNIVKAVETRKVLTKDKNIGDKIDAVLTNKWLGIPIFAAVMFLVFYICQSTLGAWIAEGYEFENGTFIPGLVPLLEIFQSWVGGLLKNANPLLSAILVDGVIGGVVAVAIMVAVVIGLIIRTNKKCGSKCSGGCSGNSCNKDFCN